MAVSAYFKFTPLTEGQSGTCACGRPATHYKASKKTYCCASTQRDCPAYREGQSRKTAAHLAEVYGPDLEQRRKDYNKRKGLKNAAKAEKERTAEIPEGQLCENGCGQPARFRLRRHEKTETGVRKVWFWCCSQHYKGCPVKAKVADKKFRATNMELYGEEIPLRAQAVKAKRAEANTAKFGGAGPLCSPVVRTKRIATCFKVYGARNPMQNGLVRRKAGKSRYDFKTYTFPSGKTARVQGYEPLVLDELLRTYPEDQIVVEDTPTVSYTDPATGQERVYFPDIFIPGENLIIEVKSPWTYFKNLEVNTAKAHACLAAGYRFQFHIKEPRDLKMTRILEEVLPELQGIPQV